MGRSDALEVVCRPADDGWTCEVRVGADERATGHIVKVERSVLDRLRPGAADPEQLVRDAFAFLLDREPRESIMANFELPVIGRYFPEWEAEIGRR